MKKIADAVKKDLVVRGISQTELAVMLDVSQPYINSLLTGKKPFGKKQAARFHNLFGYRESFLLTGEGELKIEDKLQEAASQSLNNPNMDMRINEMLTISSTLQSQFMSINKRLEEATEIIKKSQEQFDRVLDMYAQTMGANTSYGIAAENIKK